MTTTPATLIDAFAVNGTPALSGPKTVTLRDGTLLVAYLGGDPTDGDMRILAQRFDADGRAIGEEIALTDQLTDEAADFDLAVLSDGSFALSVAAPKETSVQTSIFEVEDALIVRRFEDATAFLTGTGFYGPALTSTSDGRAVLHVVDFEPFVATVSQAGVVGEGGFVPGLPSRPVESFVSPAFVEVEIASDRLANGNVVLIVDRDGDDLSRRDIEFRIVDPNGETVASGETVSNRGRTFDGTVVALKGGGFVIAMTENDGDIDLGYQVFDATGTAVSQFSYAGFGASGRSSNNEPAIAALDDGGFVIFYDRDLGTKQIRGQRFDAEGGRIGDDFLVANEQGSELSAATLSDGRIAVSWLQGQDRIKTEILAIGAVIQGTDGDDSLLGTNGNDALNGGAGDDILSGGRGADIISGGAGFDTAILAGEADARSFRVDIVAGLGTGAPEGAATATVRAFDNGDDPIIGFENPFEVDTLKSIEKIVLGDGNDLVFGGSGADVLLGGGGDDTLHGFGGDDLLQGGADDDRVTGGGGDDTLHGGSGDDSMTGDDGDDHMFGGDGDDSLSGGSGDDLLAGGNGADTLVGGPGADRLIGEGGFDTADYSLSPARIEIDLLNEVSSGGFAEGDVLESVEQILGSRFADDLQGQDGGETLSGGDGTDRLVGRGGADTLIGGKGSDTLIGGHGDDMFAWTKGDGIDAMHGDQGFDTVQIVAKNANAIFRMSESILGTQIIDVGKLIADEVAEFLEPFGDGPIRDPSIREQIKEIREALATADPGDLQPVVFANGVERVHFAGGPGNDDFSGLGASVELLLDGAGGADVLVGGARDDRLDGGSGDDRLNGGAGRDTFVFALGHGHDTVGDFTQGVDRLELDDALWVDTPAVSTGQDVIEAFGQLDAAGTLHLDFGDGGVISLEGDAGLDLGQLGEDILIV